MAKKYFLYFFFFVASAGFSQDAKFLPINQGQAIEGLSFYPNPVSNGKIYVTSRSSAEKDIQIFDVLGKKMLHVATSEKEINVSSLAPGVYIIKIRENDATATRKLIVK